MTRAVMTGVLAHNFNIDITNLHGGLNAPRTFMHDLAREGDVLSAEVIFDTDGNIDLPDDLGRRPLHEASFYGHLDMVRFLLQNGAQLDTPIQPFGHTALYLAVQQSRYDVVRHLISQGARLTVADSLTGAGLLHVAASKGDTRMAGILIAAGTDVFHEDKKGAPARDAAIRAGHGDLAGILLKVMEHHGRYAG